MARTRRITRTTVAGVGAGLLLSFGLMVMLFDLAESGSNTRPWQLLVGILAPIVILLDASRALRSRGAGEQTFGHLGLATAGGLVLGFSVLALAACRSEAHAGSNPATHVHLKISFPFDAARPGKLPPGLVPGETGGAGTPATWQVVKVKDASSPPQAFGITENHNAGSTFNLVLTKDLSLRDPDIQVAVKAVGGEEDQGGGPLWRALDADNYYLCRWNPLEDNFRVYRVKAGRRRQLASARVKADPSRWHRIRARMKGRRIECWLDGKLLLEVEDGTFPGPGMAGLWVKADGKTLFDDLVIRKP